MRVACIDIGSNTTRLLVADVDDGRLSVVTQERAFVALGRELAAAGRIGEPTLQRLGGIVERQLQTARELGAGRLRAVATAAVRDARNGAAVTDEIARRAGVELEILSCEREACLAFTGAVGMLGRTPAGTVAVVDVGGGSSQLAVGEPGRPVRWWRSITLGSSSLTDRCLRSDPPRPSQLQAAAERARAAVAPLSPPAPARALAVGGNAASLARVAGTLLDPAAFARALAALGAEPAAALGHRIDVDPRRVRLLPAALVLLEAIAGRLRVPLAIGCGGLREGVLLEAAVDRGSLRDAG